MNINIGLLTDISIGILIAVAVAVGIAIGFCRQFSKPLVVIVSTLSAIIIVMLVYPLIFNTGILNGFVSKATGWFSKDFYTREITDYESFRAAISDNYLRVLTGSADKVFARMQKVLEGADTMTIGSFFGLTLVNCIMEFAIWLVAYLIIKYFLYGVKYLLCRITEVVVFKSIDRIFGLVWSLLITYFIVVGIILTAGELTVIKFFPQYEEAFAETISQAKLLKLAHDTNVLGSFLANLLNVSLITVS